MDNDINHEDIFLNEIVIVSFANVRLTDKRIIFSSQGILVDGIPVGSNSQLIDYLNYGNVLSAECKYNRRNGLLALSFLVGLLALIASTEAVFTSMALTTSLVGLSAWWLFRIPYLKILTKDYVDPERYNISLSKLDNIDIKILISVIAEQISNS